MNAKGKTFKNAMSQIVLAITLGVVGFAFGATEKVEIAKSGFSFSPEHIQIHVGDSVEFTNVSRGVHTVTADPSLAEDPKNVILPEGVSPFHSEFIRPGNKFIHEFTTQGLYQYICLPHESMGMKGQVEVLP